MSTMVRGRVYRADIGYGPKPFLVVSNNQRNRNLDSVLAIRLTTTVKPLMPSIVVLGSGEVFSGRVLCDDIVALYPEDIRADLGALSKSAMDQVRIGLAHALAL